MQITKDDYKKVIIRKPTDEEQRIAKIITSDYAISCVTIHSSILNDLGLLDKVYRSKETIIKYSNKKEIKSCKRDLNLFVKFFPKSFTTHDAWIFNENCVKNESLIETIKDFSPKSWKGMIIPSFLKKFKTPKSFLNAEKFTRHWQQFCKKEIMEGMSDYFDSDIIIEDFRNLSESYLDKITCESIKGHSQTVIWETAFKNQLALEKELGKNFTPKQLACILSKTSLDNIEKKWGIRLEDFQYGWKELCDYLYSPEIITKIRDNIGVQVRSRIRGEVRKGTDYLDLKRYENAIKKYEQRLGCSYENFNKKIENKKIENLKDELATLNVQYNESLIAIQYAANNNDDSISKLKEASKKIKSRIDYLKKNIPLLEKELIKKIDSYETIKGFISKNEELNDFINKTRTWEEISAIEKHSLQVALDKQKSENIIPYYTWRFVCDKIDEKIAKKIESVLEENLNKGCGINGEDGYINVTAFPMSNSYEFFVDYPKNSNLFKAFKNKGLELSKILIDGVAKHLGKTFVNCQGETFINNPMDKTLSGDMFDWVGI